MSSHSYLSYLACYGLVFMLCFSCSPMVYSATHKAFVQLLYAEDEDAFNEVYENNKVGVHGTFSRIVEDLHRRMDSRLEAMFGVYEYEKPYPSGQDAKKEYDRYKPLYEGMQAANKACEQHLSFEGLSRFVEVLPLNLFIIIHAYESHVSGGRTEYRLVTYYSDHTSGDNLHRLWCSYIEQMDAKRKRDVLANFISGGGLEERDAIGVQALYIRSYVEALGPIMQKVTQKNAASFNNEDAKVDRRLLDAWRCASSSDFVFTDYDTSFVNGLFPRGVSCRQPLAQGSLAKTVSVCYEGAWYVVKYLKEGVSSEAIREEQAALCIWFEIARQEVKGLVEKMLREISFEQEREHILAGREIYEVVEGIEVVRLATEIEDQLDQRTKEACVIMRLVPGDTLGKTLEAIKNGKKEKGFIKCLASQLERFQQLFFYEALLGSHKLCHADANQGNIMVDSTGKLTLIDFGYMLNVDLPIEKSVSNKYFNIHGKMKTTPREIFKGMEVLINVSDIRELKNLGFVKPLWANFLPAIDLIKPEYVRVDGEEFSFETIDAYCNCELRKNYYEAPEAISYFTDNMRQSRGWRGFKASVIKRSFFDCLHKNLRVHEDVLLFKQAMDLVEALRGLFNEAVSAHYCKDLKDWKKDDRIEELKKSGLWMEPITWDQVKHKEYKAFIPYQPSLPSTKVAESKQCEVGEEKKGVADGSGVSVVPVAKGDGEGEEVKADEEVSFLLPVDKQRDAVFSTSTVFIVGIGVVGITLAGVVGYKVYQKRFTRRWLAV